MENTPPSPADAPPSSRRARFRRILPWIAYGAGIPLGAVLYALFVHVGCPDVLRGILTRVPGETCLSWCGTVLAWFRGSREWLLTLVGIVGIGGIVFLLAILGFLKAFKKVGHGFAATLLLFLAGLSLYGFPAVIKPSSIHGPGGWNFFAEGIVRFDNALSGFFPSRISYADIAPESSPAVAAAPTSGRLPADTPGVHIVILFYGFHLLCYAYTIALVSTFFSRRLANAVLMVGVALLDAVLGSLFRRRRPLRVFWGDGKEAYTAATEGASPRTHTVFLVPHKVPFALRLKPDPVTDRLNSDGRIRWTYASPENPGKIMAWFLARASEHFFLGEDGRKNVVHANQLLSFLASHPSRFACPAPVFHVRIDGESEEDAFFAWADQWNARTQPPSASAAPHRGWSPSIRVVREPTLVAANLLWNHPMHDVPGVRRAPDGSPAGAINLLLVGHGAHGKVLLRDMLQDAQIPGVDFRATVVDRNPDAFAALQTSAGGALAAYHVATTAVDALSSAFWNLMPTNVPDSALPPDPPSPPLWNRIVIAMENDLDNIRLALRIERHYRQCGLFGRLGADGRSVVFARVRGIRNNEYLRTLGPSSLPVSLFGSLDRLYGAETFPNDPAENAAVFLNWIYCNPAHVATDFPKADLPPDAPALWHGASSWDRESSRAAVFGLRNLAWMLGAANPVLKPSSAARRASAPLAKAITDIGDHPGRERALAETEHLRWIAFHLLRGIRPWTPTPGELGEEARKIAATCQSPAERATRGVRENQIPSRRRHAALVPFDALEDVAKAFDHANEAAGLGRRSRIAHADFDFVRAMPSILAKTDWDFPGQP